ncbi:MAG: hypothetical protein WD715_08955, partial [Dongiaceae bacterium]
GGGIAGSASSTTGAAIGADGAAAGARGGGADGRAGWLSRVSGSGTMPARCGAGAPDGGCGGG